MGVLLDQAVGLVPRGDLEAARTAASPLAGAPVRLDGQELSPQVQLGLRLERLLGRGSRARSPRPAPAAAATRRVFRGARIEVGHIEELRIPGAGGADPRPALRARRSAAPTPLIIYYHGGGHVICDLYTHDQPCRFFAREIPARVLSVDYRLGPEHRFPAAVEDSLAAFEWAHAAAEGLGADRARVAVAGDSAGANLATVVCAARGGRRRTACPRFQALIYPMIDLSAKRPSYELFGEGFFLTAAETHWFRDNYLASPDDRNDPRASPILAPDLSGLPPAHVVSAGFDPLRDEGEAYAERLREAGVRTTLRRESDMVHGFVNAVGLGGRPREATAEIAAAIGDGLTASVAERSGPPAATLTDPPG